MNYRKVNNHVAELLTLNETRTYFGLLAKSDFNTNSSSVNEETLAAFLGIAASTVSEHLKKMAEVDLIKIDTTKYNSIEYGQIHRKNRYTITYDNSIDKNGKIYDSHWVLIDTCLLNKPFQHELIGFLVKLKTICVNSTNTCAWSIRKISEEMNLGKTSVDKYLKMAEELNMITWNRKKHEIKLLDPDIFIVTKETDIAAMKRFYPEAITDEDYEAGKFITL